MAAIAIIFVCHYQQAVVNNREDHVGVGHWGRWRRERGKEEGWVGGLWGLVVWGWDGNLVVCRGWDDCHGYDREDHVGGGGGRTLTCREPSESPYVDGGNGIRGPASWPTPPGQ